jgi:acetyl esterase/lipase
MLTAMKLRIVLAGILAVLVLGSPAANGQILAPSDFQQVAPEGFGDVHNNVAWSMQWWNGGLYVGTNRDWYCWSTAAMVNAYPALSFLYPPFGNDLICAEDMLDLPLQAEIWHYTPGTSAWDMLYRAPADVPTSDFTRFTSRDIGYRGMGLFTESDGSKALYVSGVNSQPVNPAATPPRILRSADGVNFEGVPQDPGTFMGEFEKNSFRDIVEYKGKFYVVGGSIQGTGWLIESDNPSAGNDSFRIVTPPDMVIWDMAVFNGYLYVGVRNDKGIGIPGAAPVPGAQERIGFSILKTDATGEPPYTFTPVIVEGGYVEKPSKSTVSMHVFNGRLYVGTDRPAELYRIDADDTWEVIVGEPRQLPDGTWIGPISGFGPGFDWDMNIHLWRMTDHQGALYVGTADQSSRFLEWPIIGNLLRPNAGFDLWASMDDVNWTALTTTGFGTEHQLANELQGGVRTIVSTEQGVFFGTANFRGGLQLWNGKEGSGPVTLPAPSGLVGEVSGTSALLSWDPVGGASRYRIFRSAIRPITNTIRQQLELKLASAQLPDALKAELRAELNESTFRIPEPPVEIGSTTGTIWTDPTPLTAGVVYHYHVLAESATGSVSASSNVVRVPSLTAPVSFAQVTALVEKWQAGNRLRDAGGARQLLSKLFQARTFAAQGQFAKAATLVSQVRSMINGLVPSRTYRGDLDVLLRILNRRISLAKAGFVNPQLLLTSPPVAAAASQPSQPTTGPGGSSYPHASVKTTGPYYAAGPGQPENYEYYIYEPASPAPAFAPVVLFLHGWMALDPGPYVEWIKHIVRKGHTVVWVRYDAGLTLPGRFADKALLAWGDALLKLGTQVGRVRPAMQGTRPMTAFVGHSAGGVLAPAIASMLATPSPTMPPAPFTVVSVEPGGYGLIPLGDLPAVRTDTKLLLVVGEDDSAVGDNTARAIWAGTGQLGDANRDFLLVHSDRYGSPALTSDHSFPRTGGLRAEVDALDYFVTYKLTTAALNCAFRGQDCEIGFGNGAPSQLDMGLWSDGVPVIPMSWIPAPAPPDATDRPKQLTSVLN